jgi:hypothetical protein
MFFIILSLLIYFCLFVAEHIMWLNISCLKMNLVVCC